MVNEPNIRLTAVEDSEFTLSDQRKVPFLSDERDQLFGTLSKIQNQLNILNGVAITLSGNLPTHEGLGSGTAIRLAAVEAYLKLSGISFDDTKILQLSNRGGTSGVGLYGYHSGGMIFDLGVKANNQFQQPSSAVRNPVLPTLLRRSAMPNWPLALIKPRWLDGLTQSQERDFFSATLPLKAEDTRHALDVAVLGVQAAVLENDYLAFCDALENMQTTSWKNSEWNLYPPEFCELKVSLKELGADCVALSSLGPTLVVFGNQNTFSAISSANEELGIDFTLSSPSNNGRLML